MRVLSKQSAAVLDAVTANLPVGEARVLDRSPGTYMALHVDRIGENTFALAHYFTQYGDRVCDPDGEFVKTPTGWLPTALQLCTGHYTRAVELDDREVPTGYRPRALQELHSFAAMWLRNAAEQQGGLAAIRAELSTSISGNNAEV